VQDHFDPYLQWLGIQKGEHPPDCYGLLQLDLFESDSEVIALAADGAMVRVRGQWPGEHVAQWQELLDELAAAKVCLTDASRKAEYDDLLRTGSVTEAMPSTSQQPLDPSIETLASEALFPPDHRAEVVPLPLSKTTLTTTTDAFPVKAPVTADAPMAIPVDVPQHHGRSALPLSDPMAPVGDVSGLPKPLSATVVPTERPLEDPRPLLTGVTEPTRARHVVGIAVVLVGSLLLAATITLFVSGPNTDPDQAVVNGSTDQDGGQQPDPSNATADESPPSEKTIESNGPAAPPPKRPETSPRPSKPSPQPSVPRDRPKPEPPPPDSKPASPPKSKPPSKSKPVPAEPDPSPLPPPKVEPRPTARQVAAFDSALKKSLSALQRRDAATADRNLRLAEKNAISQDQRDRLERARQLELYVGEFFKAVRAGYDALEGDEELVIGGERMAVVDRTPKEITLRRRGRNVSFAPDAMPDSLSLNLALRWFDPNNPTSKVFIGAFQALRGKVDVARQLWEQARGDGVGEVDFLLPVLKEIPPLISAKRRQ